MQAQSTSTWKTAHYSGSGGQKSEEEGRLRALNPYMIEAQFVCGYGRSCKSRIARFGHNKGCTQPTSTVCNVLIYRPPPTDTHWL